MIKCEENIMTRSAPFVVMSCLATRGKRKIDSSKGGAEPHRLTMTYVTESSVRINHAEY